MNKEIVKAVKALRERTKEANKIIVQENAIRRLELTHEERLTLSRLMQDARARGTTISELCELYGSKSRKTITDILDYENVPVTPSAPTPAPIKYGDLRDYLSVEHLDDGRVRVATTRPVPVVEWQKAKPSTPWEGEVVTDGVLCDDYNYLWEELRGTDLPSRLGIKEIFEL